MNRYRDQNADDTYGEHTRQRSHRDSPNRNALGKKDDESLEENSGFKNLR
jgi:hypothetical protein